MRIKVLVIAGLCSASMHGIEALDTVALPDVEVSVSRMAQPAGKSAVQMTIVDPRMAEEAQIQTPKDLSSIAPNVYMPDYGSAMTSSIYIRTVFPSDSIDISKITQIKK